MVTAHDLAMALRTAYWVLHRRSDAQFRQGGVTADQFVLLSALSQGDQITQQELVRRTSSDPNTVRAMLVRLERRGLVSRAPHAADGRARSVALTPEGRRVHGKLLVASEPLRRKMVSGLGRKQLQCLVDMLMKIARAMTSEEGRRSSSPARKTAASPAKHDRRRR
jgi:DNA-binding MarR family transcriptional regulator